MIAPTVSEACDARRAARFRRNGRRGDHHEVMAWQLSFVFSPFQGSFESE